MSVDTSRALFSTITVYSHLPKQEVEGRLNRALYAVSREGLKFSLIANTDHPSQRPTSTSCITSLWNSFRGIPSSNDLQLNSHTFLLRGRNNQILSLDVHEIQTNNFKRLLTKNGFGACRFISGTDGNFDLLDENTLRRSLDQWNKRNSRQIHADLISSAFHSDSKELDLTHTGCNEAKKLTSLPDAIGLLQQLDSLNLRNNRLNSIGKELLQLYHLKKLNLEGNGLDKLPIDFGKLHHLSELNLNYNDFDEFPKTLCDLKHLKVLSMTSNRIKLISEHITNLQELEVLDLSDNKIAKIPAIIGQMESLRELYLSNNALESMPLEIGHIHTLKLFEASGNRHLQKIPTYIRSKIARNEDSTDLNSSSSSSSSSSE